VDVRRLVKAMAAFVLGALLGALLNAGPLAPLGAPLRFVAERLIDAAVAATSALQGPLAGVAGEQTATVIVSAVAVAAPGLVCMALVGFARTTAIVRGVAVAGAVVVAVYVTATAGLGAGLALFLVAGVLAVTGSLAVAVGRAVAGVLAVSAAAVILPVLHDTERLDAVATAMGAGTFSEPVRWLLVAVAIAPLVGTAGLALRPAGRVDGS
jgi:hypothetical protein